MAEGEIAKALETALLRGSNRRELLASIPEFSGEARRDTYDAKMWLNCVRAVAKMAEWNDEDLLYMLLSKLRGNAQRWHLINGQECKTFEEWCTKFNTSPFVRKRDPAILHRQLIHMRQFDNESLADYVSRKEKLCVELEYDTSATKIEILLGLADKFEYIAPIMRGRSHISTDHLLEDMEAELEFSYQRDASKQRRRGDTPSGNQRFGQGRGAYLAPPFAGQNTHVEAGREGDGISPGLTQKPQVALQPTAGEPPFAPQKPVAGPNTCYRCGQAGHIFRDCPLPPPTECSNCRGKGHEARNAPEG